MEVWRPRPTHEGTEEHQSAVSRFRLSLILVTLLAAMGAVALKGQDGAGSKMNSAYAETNK
ncbi:MAG: hypothetical protein V4437_00355 [Patescibacteria group bacterium]